MTQHIHQMLSIVVPNYNCLEFLPKCLASIRAQSIDNYEIIVVDDGSTDGSRDYLKRVLQESSDLRVVFVDRIGVSAARNVAIRKARGQWIAFLDADDQWYPIKTDMQLEFMRANPDVVFTFTDYDHIRENDGVNVCGCFDFWPRFSRLSTSPGHRYQLLDEPLATLLAENVVGTSTVIARRDALLAVDGFDKQLLSASDWDLWLKLAKKGKVAFSNARSTAYLMREGSISRNQTRRLDAMRIIINRHSKHPSLQHSRAPGLAEARLAEGYQEYFLSEGHPTMALKYALRALQGNPHRRTWRAFLATLFRCVVPRFSFQ